MVVTGERRRRTLEIQETNVRRMIAALSDDDLQRWLSDRCLTSDDPAWHWLREEQARRG